MKIRGMWNLHRDGTVNWDHRLHTQWDLTGRSDYFFSIWLSSKRSRHIMTFDILGRKSYLFSYLPGFHYARGGLVISWLWFMTHFIRS